MIGAVAIIMFVFGLLIGILSGFDWQAYFKYKKEITELVMKYKKEARNETNKETHQSP